MAVKLHDRDQPGLEEEAEGREGGSEWAQGRSVESLRTARQPT